MINRRTGFRALVQIHHVEALKSYAHRDIGASNAAKVLDLDDVAIADVLELAPNSVRVLRGRALRKLRKALGRGDNDQ